MALAPSDNNGAVSIATVFGVEKLTISKHCLVAKSKEIVVFQWFIQYEGEYSDREMEFLKSLLTNVA